MSKSLGNVVDPSDVILGVSLQEIQDNLLQSNLPDHEIKRYFHSSLKLIM